MLKLIIPLLSFFLGNAKTLFKNPSETITQQLVLHLRGFSLVLSSCLGSLVLLCVGTSLFLAKVAQQFDIQDEFYFTTGMWIYLAWVIITLFILIYSLRKNTWLKAMGFKQRSQESKKQSGAIESAIALLIMDFIEERQKKRQSPSSNETNV